MKNERNRSVTIVILLAGVLITTVMASFMPYSVETLLCLSAAFLIGYILCQKDRPLRLTRAFMIAPLISVILTAVMMFGKVLKMTAFIQAINLCVVAVECFIIFKSREKAKMLSCVFAILSVLFFSFGAFSHIVYGRSIMSTLAEWVLASNKVTDEKVAGVFDELTRAGEATFTVDPSKFDKTLKEETFEDMNVLYLNGDSDYDQVVFYIHGGYYVYQMGNEQMAAMNYIANSTNAMVVMPIYHLAPFTTAESGHETMAALYEKVCHENAGKKIILMGDSAGGGYSLALAESLKERGLPSPDELILLSPWVDATMSNSAMADHYDPMLTVTMGKMSGEAWAGDLPTDDPLVSPIYGDVSDLKNVTIFVGDRELFYPDDTLLYEKLKNNENVSLYIGKGQNHVYPVYPTPEGRIAVEEIIKIIER